MGVSVAVTASNPSHDELVFVVQNGAAIRRLPPKPVDHHANSHGEYVIYYHGVGCERLC